MRTRRASESGFTLIELIIAMMVISIGVVAVLGALRVAVNSGRVQRELTSAELTLRSFAEYIEAHPYVACADTTTYASGFGGNDLLAGSQLPGTRVLASGAQVSYEATVEDVFYMKAGALNDGELAFNVNDDADLDEFDTSCGSDQGLQLIHIQVAVDSAASGQPIETVVHTTVLKQVR